MHSLAWPIAKGVRNIHGLWVYKQTIAVLSNTSVEQIFSAKKVHHSSDSLIYISMEDPAVKDLDPTPALCQWGRSRLTHIPCVSPQHLVAKNQDLLTHYVAMMMCIHCIAFVYTVKYHQA